MTHDEASAIVESADGYIEISEIGDIVELDGYFMIEELQAILQLMEEA
jgi:hypothetical protein